MVDFAKQVAIYPSSAAAYDDPFFSRTPEPIEDSARPIAEDIISKHAGHRPDRPATRPTSTRSSSRRVEAALFADVPAQEALSDAVQEANALLD